MTIFGTSLKDILEVLNDLLADQKAVTEGRDYSMADFVFFYQVDGRLFDVREVLYHGLELLPLTMFVYYIQLILQFEQYLS